MDTMIQEGVLAENIFAFFMSMNPELEESELTFGHYNEEKLDGPINWHDVKYQFFWNLQLDDIIING